MCAVDPSGMSKHVGRSATLATLEHVIAAQWQCGKKHREIIDVVRRVTSVERWWRL